MARDAKGLRLEWICDVTGETAQASAVFTPAEPVDLGAIPVLVLAGGKGQRLQPFTATFPKPLMPIGDRTILEILLGRLREQGVQKVTLAVNHLAPLIRAYFGAGEALSLQIDYLYEDHPLGTAGPLGCVETAPSTRLVMNGDILTDLDFRAFIAAHRQAGAALTVATIVQRFQIDSGVVEVDDAGFISGFREKPVTHHRICIGVYAVEPHAQALVAPNARLDMPDLIMRLVARGERVAVFDHPGTWIDIGRPDDLSKAQQFAETFREAEVSPQTV